ncbi:MAG: NUDIX domain-containing protein [Anaerolineales bacterium]
MEPEQIPVLYAVAGGVVYDIQKRQVVVLIRPSRDEIRLPKGHILPEENPEQAALREITEETGYSDLEIALTLGEQLVVFPFGKHTIRRTEYYYLVYLRSEQQVERPPADEEEFFPIWISLNEALEHLTFEAEREWIRRAQAYLIERREDGA